MATKRYTKGLKITRKRELHDGYASGKRYPKAYAITEFLFSTTGDTFIERKNFLIEKEYLRDVPADVSTYDKQVYEPARQKGECIYTRRIETSQRLLCIGGPLDSQRVTDAPGYTMYNAASFNRGRAKNTHTRAVYIHEQIVGRI